MTLLIKPERSIPTLLAAALLWAATPLQAAPMSVGIDSLALTIGSGYGVDGGSNGENGGQLLDVSFGNSFAPQSFTLAHVGDSFSFDLLTVSFNEPDTGSGGNKGIRSDETDGLGLSLRFSFSGPAGLLVDLTALATATTGTIADAAVDYALGWTPVEADFGAGGRLRLSVNDLSFGNSNLGPQTARATVELLSAPQPQRIAEVPEPGSFALAGVALVAAGGLRRRLKRP